VVIIVMRVMVILKLLLLRIIANLLQKEMRATLALLVLINNSITSYICISDYILFL